MSACVSDTHATIWYLLDRPLLSPAASAALDAAEQAEAPIYIPSITLVEITYLVERGRLPLNAWDILADALDDSRRVLTLAPLDLAVARALQSIPRDEVPDMPDRIIAATAVALGLPLVTRDSRIRLTSIQTVW